MMYVSIEQCNQSIKEVTECLLEIAVRLTNRSNYSFPVSVRLLPLESDFRRMGTVVILILLMFVLTIPRDYSHCTL